MAAKVLIESQGSQLNKSPEDVEVKILWFNIGHLNSTAQFILSCGTLFVLYIVNGYIQELMFVLDGFKPYGWYLTLVQFVYFTIFALIESAYKGTLSCRKIPMNTYLLLALLTLGTIGFSNIALEYLNYPTQIMFKCCKLIPVMIGSILIQQKRYGLMDYLAAGSMCVGLTLFTLADVQVSPSFNTTGIVMITCALLCDAVIGNVQEKWMKAHRATNTEVILYSYGVGFVMLFLAMLITGQLHAGIQFYASHPRETYGYALLFSATGYLGIHLVLTLVQTHGALVTATVTTCRKAVTIIISFVFFDKPFIVQYVWSGMLVVLGIFLNVYSSKHQPALNLSVLRKYVVMMKTACNLQDGASSNLKVSRRS